MNTSCNKTKLLGALTALLVTLQFTSAAGLKEGDPFPDHTYVCSSCGAEYARAKWVDLEQAKKPQCALNQQGVPNHCWWGSIDHNICATCCHCLRLRVPAVDPPVEDWRKLLR